MKKNALISCSLILTGTALVGRGLFTPLLKAPMAGMLRFSEAHLGGTALAVTILVLMLLSILSTVCVNRLQRVGWLCAGGAAGLCAGSMLALYRSETDQLQQIADSIGLNVADLMAQVEYGLGLWLFCIGLALWAGGLCIAVSFKTLKG